MKRVVVFLGLVLAQNFVTSARADMLLLSYSGTIDSVVDASTLGEPPINFTPIPVGSSFSGTFTYNSNSPQTGGGLGFASYDNLAPAIGSVTINGNTFTTTNPGFANPSIHIISKESGNSISGVAISTQPISLPAGWSVMDTVTSLPYFTLQFFNVPAQSQSLALPTIATDLPLVRDLLILDFQQPLTVGGETFGGRVFVTGNITSFSLGGQTVPEPNSLTLSLTCLVGLFGTWMVRRPRKAAVLHPESPSAHS
jgi:hypothetical protein